MNIVLINSESAFLLVCCFPFLHAEGRFPVPYRFFSHFVTVGVSEMESHLVSIHMPHLKRQEVHF